MARLPTAKLIIVFDPGDGYFLSAVLLLLGGVAFAVLMWQVSRSVRRFTSVSAAVVAVWRGELMLLRARRAALKIAVRQRWPKENE